MLPAITTPPSGTPITPEQASIIAGTQELMNNPPEVDLPFSNTVARTLSGSLTYLREFDTGNVNLSGVSETLLKDKPAITKGGLSVYEEFDNELLWSEDFSNAAWIKIDLIVSVGGTTSPDISVLADKIIAGDVVPPTFHRVKQNLVTGTGESYYSVHLKAGEISSAGFDVINGTDSIMVAANLDLTTGVLSDVTGDLSVKKLNDGWWRISAKATSTVPVSSIRIYPTTRSVPTTGDGVSGLYVWGAQASKVNGPYKKTTTAPATRGADMASIPMMNNMPAAGNPFTIVLDASSATDGNNYAYYSSGNVVTTSGFAMRKNFTAGGILFFMSDGVSVVNVLSASLDGQPHKIVMVYDGNLIIMYIDGLEVKRATQGYAVYDVTDQLDFGARAGSQYLNSEIKNFEIYHVALSSDAVLALGAAS